jgi:hypothetical protein
VPTADQSIDHTPTAQRSVAVIRIPPRGIPTQPPGTYGLVVQAGDERHNYPLLQIRDGEYHTDAADREIAAIGWRRCEDWAVVADDRVMAEIEPVSEAERRAGHLT